MDDKDRSSRCDPGEGGKGHLINRYSSGWQEKDSSRIGERSLTSK